MPTQKCLDNIARQKPPSNIPCTSAFCQQISHDLNIHCNTDSYPPDTPVISYDPALKSTCYCCCSCFTLNTPIAIAENEFVFIQNVEKGNTVLTAGTDMTWRPGTVESRTGDLTLEMIPGLYLIRYKMAGEQASREIIVTADHLFMVSDKTLKQVQHLIPGDALLAADGTSATVEFVVYGSYEDTNIQSINMEGDFDGKNLDGHLLNINGIVSTDFKVQAYYEINNLDKTYDWEYDYGDGTEVLTVGEPGYIEKFNCDAIGAFLDDPMQWPKGFMPLRRKLVNVPRNAKKFLTEGQAHEVRENADFSPYSSPRDTITKILDIYRSKYPQITYILDWYNDSPNAYSWQMESQRFVLITGGMVRIENLYTDGYSLIIADMTSRILDNYCVAEGDYNGLVLMRLVWPNSILETMLVQGISEIESAIFQHIVKFRGGNAKEVCDHPSIDCRIESFYAGLSLLPIPTCGVPASQSFTVKNAFANLELTEIEITFSEDVNVTTGSSTVNYSLTGDLVIDDAKVTKNIVVLSVTGLEAGKRYVLEIAAIKSIYDVVIQPNPALEIISTDIIVNP